MAENPPKEEPKKRRKLVSRRGFLKTATAAVAVAGGATYFSNDWSSPSLQSKIHDYRGKLEKLDPDQPIGVLMINVDRKEAGPVETEIINAARNNYIKTMRQQYGDNFIMVEDASMDDLMEFARIFNIKFAGVRTQVHFVANHHQDCYDDKKLAAFLNAVTAQSKRAIIYACGPDPEAYKNAGCDYVVLPRVNGRILGPELSFKISPAYMDLIGLVRHSSTPEPVQKRLRERSILERARDKASSFVVKACYGSSCPSDTEGVVVTRDGISYATGVAGISR